MYPEPTELRLIGYLTEYLWTAKSKSSMSTPDTWWMEQSSPLVQYQHFQLRQLPRSAMSKRMQPGTGEEITVAKWEPTLNLVSRSVTSSPAAPSWSASNRPGMLRAPSQQGSNLIAQSAGKSAARGSTQNWRSVEFSSVGNRCKNERQCEETRCCRNEPGSEKPECARKFAAENSDINDDDSKWPNDYHISLADVPRLQKVYSNLRRQLERKPEDKMEDFDVNTLIWRNVYDCHSAVAVHLGNDSFPNLHSTTNQPQRTVKQLFDVTGRLVRWSIGRTNLGEGRHCWLTE